MQFNLADDRVVVENLQKMLRTIFLITGDTNYEIGVSGVYGEGTINAVRYFQQSHHLPVIGIVDLPTWIAIADEYDRLSLFGNPPRGIAPFPYVQNTVVKSGERSDLVTIIQLILNTLTVLYDFAHVPISGFYDASTADAVRKFQDINALPSPAGAVDRLTWNMLAEEYNHTVNYD